jgi:LDH2 family malate/lactate/ureidoglycolate dehydrogenase
MTPPAGSQPAGVVCPAPGLEAFAVAVVHGLGAPADVAAEVGRHLVRSNLSGHDSHGVIRLPQYAAEADRGELVPSALPVVLRQTEVAALVDAGLGFGHFSTMFALDWAIVRAGRHGVALASVRHSTHIGRLGEYAERAAAAGLVSLVTVGLAGPGAGIVVPFGGRERFLGTNPWAISVPGQTGALVFDAATAVTAEGKVRVARAKGAELPPGTVQDRDGRPSRSPEAFYAGGALLPLGGESAGHKGYGLGLASALIGGLAMGDDPTPFPGRAPADATGRIMGVFIQVIDPACFGDPVAYRTLVDEVLAAARRVPPAAGREAVLVPGDPESRTREQRGAHGVPLAAGTWAELGALGARLGVGAPPHRPG